MLCFGRDVFFGFTIYLHRAREHMSYRTLQTFMLFVTSMYRAVLATVKSSPFRWALLVVVLILMQPEHAARLFQLQALWKATQLITEKFFAIYVISFLVMASIVILDQRPMRDFWIRSKKKFGDRFLVVSEWCKQFVAPAVFLLVAQITTDWVLGVSLIQRAAYSKDLVMIPSLSTSTPFVVQAAAQLFAMLPKLQDLILQMASTGFLCLLWLGLSIGAAQEIADISVNVKADPSSGPMRKLLAFGLHGCLLLLQSLWLIRDAFPPERGLAQLFGVAILERLSMVVLFGVLRFGIPRVAVDALSKACSNASISDENRHALRLAALMVIEQCLSAWSFFIVPGLAAELRDAARLPTQCAAMGTFFLVAVSAWSIWFIHYMVTLVSIVIKLRAISDQVLSVDLAPEHAKTLLDAVKGCLQPVLDRKDRFLREATEAAQAVAAGLNAASALLLPGDNASISVHRNRRQFRIKAHRDIIERCQRSQEFGVQWLIMVGAQLSERIRAAVKACGRTLEKMTKYERHTIVTVSQSPRQVRHCRHDHVDVPSRFDEAPAELLGLHHGEFEVQEEAIQGEAVWCCIHNTSAGRMMPLLRELNEREPAPFDSCYQHDVRDSTSWCCLLTQKGVSNLIASSAHQLFGFAGVSEQPVQPVQPVEADRLGGLFKGMSGLLKGWSLFRKVQKAIEQPAARSELATSILNCVPSKIETSLDVRLRVRNGISSSWEGVSDLSFQLVKTSLPGAQSSDDVLMSLMTKRPVWIPPKEKGLLSSMPSFALPGYIYLPVQLVIKPKQLACALAKNDSVELLFGVSSMEFDSQRRESFALRKDAIDLRAWVKKQFDQLPKIVEVKDYQHFVEMHPNVTIDACDEMKQNECNDFATQAKDEFDAFLKVFEDQTSSAGGNSDGPAVMENAQILDVIAHVVHFYVAINDLRIASHLTFRAQLRSVVQHCMGRMRASNLNQNIEQQGNAAPDRHVDLSGRSLIFALAVVSLKMLDAMSREPHITMTQQTLSSVNPSVTGRS